MNKTLIEVENLSKLYRLGEVGTGTISHDLNRWWHKVRGKEDPYLKIGQVNDRTVKADNQYSWALKDINFSVRQGEVLGIIGHNGAGKSTLLKILSKITSPTTGKIKIEGRVASLLEVGTGFHPEMTGRENAYMNGAILGMRKAEITKKLDEIVAFAGVERYIDTPVKRYSSGMKVRLGFAVAAHLEPEILIVDEVLAVGDAEFQKKCIGKMKEVSDLEGRTVLFVSHNMAAIMRLCSRAILMSRGGIIRDGDIADITGFYLNETSATDSITLDNPYLKTVAIRQIEDKLEIVCTYESKDILTKPILGFIVSDTSGNKIFGSNSMYQPPVNPIIPSTKGEIKVSVKYPQLLNGTYLLSIFMADGVLGDLAKFEHVIAFTVYNMVRYEKEVSPSLLGPVSPVVEWEYFKK